MKSKPLFPNQTVTTTGLPPSSELIQVIQRIVGDILTGEEGLAALSATVSALSANLGGVTSLSSDVSTTSTSLSDVTGLSFPVTAGTRYYFKFFVDFTSAATTTGLNIAFNGPAASRISARMVTDTGVAATQVALGISAYDAPGTAVTASATTGASIATIEGFVTPSADGTVIARFATEVAASAITIKAGSNVQWRQV